MKKLVCALLLFGFISNAQNPQLNVKGKDSAQVKMSQLLVSVKVVGNIAYTTAEMHFTNTSSRQMEAELLFPLPEGVSVSRYAIDINGKMREAVPVNKTKGKQVFEAIEHRRVDPGLLEKVDGNNFKTRIYPILPNKERIVIIGYEQELPGFDKDNLAYQLLSKYPQKLDKFEVNVVILGTVSAPSIINESNDSTIMNPVSENNWNQSYQTSIKKTNYQPSEKFTIKIPIRQDIPSVVTQTVSDQHYFYATTFIEGKKIQKKNPKSIGLIWDVSLSCKNRELKKELALLDAYFKELKNVTVTLAFTGYNFQLKNKYTITDGNWSELKTQLENAIYDGGTRFSKIKFNDEKLNELDEFLLFTDGLSSLSDNQLPKSKSPLYIITSSASSDYAFLNYNALITGGNSINLNALNTTKALDKLIYQNLKFLGVKENYSIVELYPMIGSAVSGNFTLSGISLKEQNEVILLFGYNNEAVIEKKIIINTASQNTNDVNIEKLWAQKKIANLEIQYKKNADEIESLGKKFGIVTQNTSLIVLEDINDYIQYDIVPPTELRAEFDRVQKQQRESRLAEQKSNWENVENYYNQLNSWWNKDIKYQKPKPIPLEKPKKTVRNTSNRNNRNIANKTASGNIRGIILDESGLPIPGANIVQKGTRNSTSTDFDGLYAINAKKDDVIQVSYIGYEPKEFKVRNSGVYNVSLENSSSQLNEVVVVGYGSIKKSDLTGSVASVSAKDLRRKSKEEMSEVLSGNNNAADADANINNSIASDTISIAAPRRQATKVNSWSPDRIYLKAIAAAPDNKKYEAYLQLRESQLTNPSYYFDMANYFYNNGDKKTALLILSNIADLGLENHQLYKSLTYQLRQWEAYEDALYTANQVAKWRSFEPQSHRDLGLTLEDNKQYQAAFDELIKALEVNYFGNMSGQYSGIEDIILMDLNRMIAEHNIKTTKLDKKYLSKMPVSVRIILNWNQMDTDIDLHVVEPTGEECYFGNRDTQAGARFSKDFTQGYGPEQYILRNKVNGKFIVKTNFYGESALTENGPTTVMVEVYTTKNGKTTRKLQTIQLGKIKQNENLAEINID